MQVSFSDTIEFRNGYLVEVEVTADIEIGEKRWSRDPQDWVDEVTDIEAEFSPKLPANIAKGLIRKNWDDWAEKALEQAHD